MYVYIITKYYIQAIQRINNTHATYIYINIEQVLGGYYDYSPCEGCPRTIVINIDIIIIVIILIISSSIINTYIYIYTSSLSFSLSLYI